MNMFKALDENIDEELKEARAEAERLMGQTEAAYRRVYELEMARDMRRAIFEARRPATSAEVVSIAARRAGTSG